MIRKFSFGRGGCRPLIALAGALLMSLGVVAPAFAATTSTVTTTVVGGLRTASIPNATLGSVNYAHADQTVSGTLNLTADDSSGTNLGWNVTVVSSSFAYTGTFGGVAIPASNFALTNAADPVK